MDWLTNLLGMDSTGFNASVPQNIGNFSPAPAAASAPSAPVDKGPSGMFGIRGAPRNILGLIGDSLLVNAGHEQIYRPQVMREQQGSAMSDFLLNPSVEGIREMAKVNPEAAWNMYQGYLKSQADASELGLKREKAGRELEEHEWKRDKAGFDQDMRTAQILSDIHRSASPETWSQVRQVMEDTARRRGYTMPGELPEQYDPDFDIRHWAMDASDEALVDYRQDRLADFDSDRIVRITEGALDRAASLERVDRQQAGATERTNITQQGATDRHTTPRAAPQKAGRSGGDRPPPPQKEGQKIRDRSTGQVLRAVKVGNTLTWRPVS